jgi:hypothetical protein
MLCLLLPVTGGATSSRILSLGGDGDYFEDEHNVLRWFGSLSDYRDIVVVELGDIQNGEATAEQDAVSQGAGLHYGLDGRGVWGTVAVYVSDARRGGRAPGDFALLWSRRWGRLQAGFYYSYYGTTRIEYTSGPGTVEPNYMDQTLGLGVRAELQERFYFDLAGEWMNTDREYFIGEAHDLQAENAWDSFAIRVRGFYGVTDRVALVPLLSHRKSDHLSFAESLDQVGDWDARTSRLGVGVSVFPDSDHMLLGSWEYRWLKEDHAGRPVPAAEAWLSERCGDGHILRLGMESRLASWLSLRAGARQVVLEERHRLDRIGSAMPANGKAPDVRDSVRKDPELDLAVGLALHLGSFAADFVFNDDAPFSFGYLFTGAGQTESHTFTSITLSYTF